MKRKLISLVLGLTSSVVFAKTYTATNWLAPTHTLNDSTYQQWVSEVKQATNGEVDFKVHSSASLLPAKSTMQGIKDRVADVGIVFPSYTPAHFPLNSLLNDLMFVAKDHFVAAFAFTEMGMTNKDVQKEWLKNGGVFAGGYSMPLYHFACVKPINTVNDTKGLKIRSAGYAQTEWVKSLGAIPVSVSSNEIYTGLERKSIDCALTDMTNLDTGYRLWEVVKSVNTLPLGVVVGANYVYNTKFWKELSPQNRRHLLDTMAFATARTQVMFQQGVEKARKGSLERGLEFIEPSEDLKVALDVFSKSFIENIPKNAKEADKVVNVSEFIKTYLELESKWQMLLENVDRTDIHAVYKVLQENLYSKIDEKMFAIE